MKRMISLLLALALLFALLPQATLPAFADEPALENTCGMNDDNLLWFFDEETGTLTITGSGEMQDYTVGAAPWDSFKEIIVGLELPKGLTSIGKSAFYGCNSLKEADIPDGVQSIGAYAFWDCAALEWVMIPGSVQSVGYQAFADCKSLEMVHFDAGSLQSIEDGAFFRCSKLQQIALPDSVQTVGPSAFAECTGLQKIQLGSSLRELGADAFDSCALTEVEIPDGVTVIHNHCFALCRALKSVKLPAQLETIEMNAFFGCDALESLTIPASVTTIWPKALGYSADPETEEEYKLENFTICGKKGSTAETYANEHGFPFVEVGDQPEEPVAPTFVDVSKDSWFFTAVHWATTQNPPITNGVDATHFEPYNTCSRAEFVQFLYNAWGKPAVGDAQNPFEDVAEDAWYYKAVLWAYMQGVTSGIDATHFAPNKKCTRAEVVQFLSNSSGGDLPDGQENPFVDVSADDWYYNAVRWAARWHITSGVDETHFAPGKTCTRAEVVQFLYQLDQMSESMK